MATDDEFSLFRDGGSSAVARADQAQGGGVDHFRIADDGRTVVTAGGDGVIRLWSMPSLEPLLTLRSRPESRVTALSVLDDRSILVGHADGTVRRYEAVPRAVNTVP
jgi:WD40 repeat protein